VSIGQAVRIILCWLNHRAHDFTKLVRRLGRSMRIVKGFISVIVIVVELACLGYLFAAAIGTVDADQIPERETWPTTAAIFVGAMLIVMVLGVVLIRNSRPFSAGLIGYVVTLLGIGLVLISLAVLVQLCLSIRLQPVLDWPAVGSSVIDAEFAEVVGRAVGLY
jgi:hypothetical protein